MNSPATHVQTEHPRIKELLNWLDSLKHQFSLIPSSIRAASSDASFRQYFRVDGTVDRTVERTVDQTQSSFIVMDSPPDKEDCQPFITIAKLLYDHGIHVPTIFAQNIKQGFLLLEDFGDINLLSQLKVANPEDSAALYFSVIDALIQIQLIPAPAISGLPTYDQERLKIELDLFPTWYLQRHLSFTLNQKQQDSLEQVFNTLIDNALAQTRVLVHRDYHSRNLMITADHSPGILDFQDAVLGPISYDLVSLIRDAYINWPEPQQIDWCVRYWEKAREQGLKVNQDFGAFYQELEWMGLQRHLKILGVFARLHHRDGKSNYLEAMPRIVQYIRSVIGRYSAFKPLQQLFDHLDEVCEVNHPNAVEQAGKMSAQGKRVGYTF